MVSIVHKNIFSFRHIYRMDVVLVVITTKRWHIKISIMLNRFNHSMMFIIFLLHMVHSRCNQFHLPILKRCKNKNKISKTLNSYSKSIHILIYLAKIYVLFIYNLEIMTVPTNTWTFQLIFLFCRMLLLNIWVISFEL